jgi:hypothetical protein
MMYRRCHRSLDIFALHSHLPSSVSFDFKGSNLRPLNRLKCLGWLPSSRLGIEYDLVLLTPCGRRSPVGPSVFDLPRHLGETQSLAALCKFVSIAENLLGGFQAGILIASKECLGIDDSGGAGHDSEIMVHDFDDYIKQNCHLLLGCSFRIFFV